MSNIFVNSVNTKRKGWIDALRGLAIILVIYGHSISNLPGYYIFTSPIKMPLFFAISGYVFHLTRYGDFAKQLVKKVIVPWFCLGLLYPLLTLPSKGFYYLWDYFLQMLSGEVLWFMPCFVVGQLIQFLIRKSTSNKIGVVVLSFLCFSIGMIMHHYDILNYALINNAFVVQPFYLIGFLFHEYESHFISLKWKWIGIAAIVYIALCLLSMKLYPNTYLDVHLNSYYNIPFCLFLIYLGCFVLFTAARKADFHSITMSFIGQNTLILYIMHVFFIVILIQIASIMGWEMPRNWWTALIKVVWACVSCGALAVMLNKYLPEIVGKKRRNE